MHLFYQPDFGTNPVLTDDEARHVMVMRQRPGDYIHVTDGTGCIYESEITSVEKKTVTTTIRSTEEINKPVALAIAIAPTKNSDRMEWFVEKSVELGISSIYFMQTHHSMKPRLNLERLKKKAIAAMKQSLKAHLPELSGVLSFEDALQLSYDQKFIAYVDPMHDKHLINAVRPRESACVYVGPEGDFAQHEVQDAMEKGCIQVSLGKSRLRTETAGIAACHILNLVNS